MGWLVICHLRRRRSAASPMQTGPSTTCRELHSGSRQLSTGARRGVMKSRSQRRRQCPHARGEKCRQAEGAGQDVPGNRCAGSDLGPGASSPCPAYRRRAGIARPTRRARSLLVRNLDGRQSSSRVPRRHGLPALTRSVGSSTVGVPSRSRLHGYLAIPVHPGETWTAQHPEPAQPRCSSAPRVPDGRWHPPGLAASSPAPRRTSALGAADLLSQQTIPLSAAIPEPSRGSRRGRSATPDHRRWRDRRPVRCRRRGRPAARGCPRTSATPTRTAHVEKHPSARCSPA